MSIYLKPFVAVLILSFNIFILLNILNHYEILGTGLFLLLVIDSTIQLNSRERKKNVNSFVKVCQTGLKKMGLIWFTRAYFSFLEALH